MNIFLPNYFFNKIWDITEEDLEKIGVHLLILDVDNTLTEHKQTFLHSKVEEWLTAVKNNTQIQLVIMSNTNNLKIKKIAEEKGIPYLGNAHKPLSYGFKMVMSKASVKKSEVAIIGDQIYTDILGGNLFGIKTILVTPIKLENTFFFKLKRKLEAPFLNQIENKKRK